MSSAGNSGYCPPPGAAEWQSGLTEGHWCVQLSIEDGGPNDDDGIANGTIVDPGGVSVMRNNNTLPLAVADAVTVPVNQSAEIDVLANDTDADADNLTVKQVNSQFGSATVQDNRLISYVPADDFIGTDILEYSISDGKGGTASNKVTVTVVANRAPIALDDMGSTDDKTILILDVLSNDSDPDNQALSIIAASAQQGSVMIVNNKLRYTPKTGFEGVDTVSYSISDGTGGEASAKAMITVKAYKQQVIENQSGGGSVNWLWSCVLLIILLVRRRSHYLLKLNKALWVSVLMWLGILSQAQAQQMQTSEGGQLSPWYVNVAVGVSESNKTKSKLQRDITTAQVDGFDDSDTSFGVSVGYQIAPTVAFEVGYADFGNGSAQLSGETLDPQQYHQLFKSVSPILPQGFNMGLRFTLADYQGWRFSVPVGMLIWEAEINSYSNGQRLKTQFDGTDWYTGLQLDYQFDPRWSAGVGVNYIALAPNDISSYQVSVKYQF